MMGAQAHASNDTLSNVRVAVQRPLDGHSILLLDRYCIGLVSIASRTSLK